MSAVSFHVSCFNSPGFAGDPIKKEHIPGRINRLEIVDNMLWCEGELRERKVRNAPQEDIDRMEALVKSSHALLQVYDAALLQLRAMYQDALKNGLPVELFQKDKS